ncbi:MAG: hypothetical protein E7678_05805 [Ruminococcaceae bacterium]|nr:hypothetical protein [Oscillospiraceae bacterium]
MNEKWFLLPVGDIEKKLKTNAASGLTVKAARSRVRKDEPFFKIRKKSIGMLIVDLFFDFFLLLLTLTSFFALFFDGDRIIGGATLVVILIVLAFVFLLHFRDKRSVESLSALFLPTARVIRGGKLYILDYKDVVVGDVIMIEKGDIIGVDARLVYSDNLKVKMRVDKKSEKELAKYANGAVNPEELYAENMVNMIHAGSVVQEGNGRAVVIATGSYTYLGSMVGGLSQGTDDELPDTLKILQKKCSKFSMILLIALLPFCVISLLLGSLTGGTAVLSQTLMVALAFGATFRLSSFSTVFIAFFNRYLRKAAISDNPCILRSAKTLDKLADTDYIFVLDGSVATDGILHFEALETADGTLKNLENITGSAAELFNMATIYAQARTAAPSIGVKSHGMIDIAIEELLKKSQFDRDALKIRCTVNSYIPTVDKTVGDTVQYTDLGQDKTMYVSMSSFSIEKCSLVSVSGEVKPLSYEGMQDLKKAFYSDVNAGKKPIVFISEINGEFCFVGMLVLREGLDYTTVHAVNEFRRNGINVITFSNCYDRDSSVPEIPDLLKSEKVATFVDFSRREIPITFEFGNYNEYSGFGSNEIYELAKLVKNSGKTLAVIGFSDYAEKTVELADVFITCAPISIQSSGRFDEEITTLEVPGEESSANCLQTVKANADVLLMRPKGGKGGLEPLMRVMEYCNIAYRNLNRFLIYIFCVQITRMIAIMLPLLFGGATVDARHITMLGIFFDTFAFALFMMNSRRAGASVKSIKKLYAEENFKDILKKYKNILICTTFSGLLVVFLPTIFDTFKLFGGYQYKEEFTYLSLVFIQFVIFAAIYIFDLRNKSMVKSLFTRKIFLAEIIIFVLITALSFLITPIGDFMGLESGFVTITPFYFLLTIVPAFAFAVCYIVMFATDNSNEKKGTKPEFVTSSRKGEDDNHRKL